MKKTCFRKLLHALLFMSFASLAFPENPEARMTGTDPFAAQQFTGDDVIHSDLSYLDTLYPCGKNSSREKDAYRYIRQRLDSLYVFYYEQSLDTLRGYHSFAYNIIVDFPGKTDETMLLVIPVNNLENNSVNIAAGLRLCAFFGSHEPEKNVKIVFAGSEYSPDTIDQKEYFYKKALEKSIAVPVIREDEQTGSRVFLQDYYPESKVSLFYLNLKDPGGQVEAVNTSRKGATPLWLLKQTAEKLEKAGIDFTVDIRKNRLFRAGYDAKSQTDVFIENSIPSMLLTTGKVSEKTGENEYYTDPEKLIKDLTVFFLSMSDTPGRDVWEKNYIILPLRGRYVFLDEKTGLTVYIVLIVSFLLFAVFKGRIFLRYIQKILRYFWVLPWLFTLCFVFLFLATITTEFIISLKGISAVWIETPFTVFIIKILTSLLLLFSSFFLLQKIRLPASGSFYSASSILIMVINLLVFQFLNITLIFYAIWALFWTILFSFSENRVTKGTCIIISYYLIFDIVRYIFAVPALNLCDMLITDRIMGNLLIAVVLMPMILMILRVLIVHTHFESRKYLIVRRVIYSVTLVSLISISVRYYYLDIFKLRRQPVFAVANIDLDAGTSVFSVSSPVSPDGVTASFTGSSIIFTGRDITRSISLDSPDPVSLQIKKRLSYFLDRKNIILEIVPPGTPERVEVFYSCDENQIILDSNYPFTVNSSLDSGEFHIGYNPDFPLKLDLLVNNGASFWFTIKLIYRIPPFDMELSGENMEFSRQVVIKKSIYG